MQVSSQLADEQFEVLGRLVHRIVESGSQILIVDLPIPRWHSQASPYYADYQERKKTVLSEIRGLDGVFYMNMQDADADRDYYDDAHPKRAATKVWCTRLSGVLNPIIGGTPDLAAAVSRAKSL